MHVSFILCPHAGAVEGGARLLCVQNRGGGIVSAVSPWTHTARTSDKMCRRSTVRNHSHDVRTYVHTILLYKVHV